MGDIIQKNDIRINHLVYLRNRKRISKHRRIMLLEHLIDSVVADGDYFDKLDEHDNMFIPQNDYERRVWEDWREMAKADIRNLKSKIDGGKKSAEIKQLAKEEEKVVQEPVKQEIKGAFVPPTEEEAIAYAKQMFDIIPAAGGFKANREMVVAWFLNYDRQGWMLGNNVHMTNWKSSLRKWCIDNNNKKE